jgi:hypothetical protein
VMIHKTTFLPVPSLVDFTGSCLLLQVCGSKVEKKKILASHMSVNGSTLQQPPSQYMGPWRLEKIIGFRKTEFPGIKN